MGYGQFSATSVRRTKAEQLQAAVAQGLNVITSRRVGHNRMQFTTDDGAQHFMLHETVIASVNPDRTQLTLNDGGWPSITTRKAFSEAVAAFGLPSLNVGGGRPRASHMLGFRMNGGAGWAWGRIVFDRTVALTWFGTEYSLAPGCQPIAAPMIRAIVEGATSLEVQYLDGEVVSNNGDRFKVSPTRLIITLEDLLTLARKSSRFIGWRHDPINYKNELPIFKGAHHAYAGSRGKHVHVGCHEFSTSDIRNILQRLKLDHAEAATKAKAFLKARKAEPIRMPAHMQVVADATAGA